ncbi:MAG: MMPL family transporter [Candidatus Bipolaricaulota bacterium]|nr:MMPL family transporter [Candidatus Bipolaricaulota bacterium]
MDKLAKWIIRRPWITLGVLLLVTGFFLAGIPRLQVDNSVGSMLPAEHPARLLYDEVDDTFGGTDVMVVVVRSGDVFSTTTLEQVIDLTEAFQGLPGVDEVISLSTAKRMQGEEGTLIVRDLMPTVPVDAEGRDDLRAYVLSNELYINNVISSDGLYAGIVVELLPDTDDSVVYTSLRQIIGEQENTSDIYVAGGPAIKAEMSSSMKSDLMRLIPFVILVLAMVLYLSLRTVSGVLLPLAVVFLTVIWTVGLMGWTGTAMAMISTTMPIMLIAIGVADAIHILTEYYGSLRSGEKKEAAIRTVVRHIGIAIVLTSITTLVGFLSLGTSPVQQVMQFGLFVGFGVMAALVITMTLIPAALKLGRVPRTTTRTAASRKTVTTRGLTWLSRMVIKHRKAILIIGAVVFLFAVIGGTRLTVETNTLRFFRPDTPIRQATEVVDSSFGGSESLSVIANGDIKSPDVLNAMLDFQEWAKELPEVGYTASIADNIAQINESLRDNDPAQHVIPQTRNAVAQEILLYEMSSDPSDFARVVNYNYEQARIVLRMESLSSAQLGQLVQQVDDEATRIAAGQFDAEITGSSYLFKVLTDLLVHGQIISLLVSLFGVALVVGLIFRSVRFGLLSIIPLGFTIMLNFGIMGWLNIPLDTATTMLASIAIGIGVDYTVHFLAKYRRERRAKSLSNNAVSETIRTTGRAIVYNVVAVAAGFAVLLFSSFGPIATLGALVALSMGISGLAALTLLPAALLVTERKGKKA